MRTQWGGENPLVPRYFLTPTTYLSTSCVSVSSSNLKIVYFASSVLKSATLARCGRFPCPLY